MASWKDASDKHSFKEVTPAVKFFELTESSDFIWEHFFVLVMLEHAQIIKNDFEQFGYSLYQKKRRKC